MRGTDEIIQGKSADRVRGVDNLATAVADLQIRVMVLLMGDPGHGIHKGHGFVIVLEVKLAGRVALLDARIG